MKDKITGPLFKWFGSKWSASRYYPEPSHDLIVEPFAGSAGYSLRHHRCSVVLTESNENLRELWRWLITDATEQQIRDIPTQIKEGTDIREIGLNRGQELLLKNWQRTNNVGNCWTISPWGNKPGQWTDNTRARVASEHHLIEHWKVCDDGFKVIDDHRKQEDVTFFVDPPYQHNYQYGSNAVDYHALASALLDTSGQLIVCEAVCQKTGKVPDWLPFEPFRKTVTSRRKDSNNHHSSELLFHRK